MQRLHKLGLGLTILIGLGCDATPYQVVPVSGEITLGGEPLAGARINTQPIATSEAPNPGPGSFAVTDESGRYELELVNPPQSGAVVANHRVRISKTSASYKPGREDAPVMSRDPLPPEARDGSILLEVPVDGTDSADFRF